MRPPSLTRRICAKTVAPAVGSPGPPTYRKNLIKMDDSPEARSQLVAEKCVSLGPGVRRIVAGNAGLMTGPGTNTYLFGIRDVAVLDPWAHHGPRLEGPFSAT